jgi:predicted dehydrogenase
LAEPLTLALIGLGKHAARTVVPAIGRSTAARLGAVVVRDRAAQAESHPTLAALLSDDPSAVLADPVIDAVYVATPLATHARFVEAALNAGKHVLCEKPVTPSLAETKRLSDIAAAADLGLFEIDYYQRHAQFRALGAMIAARRNEGQRLIAAETIFTIPELPADDIRYRADLAGGALFDVGYYPLSGALALFGKPESVAATGRWDSERGVDLGGSALLQYGGFAVHAHWAIGASYRNEIAVSLSSSRLIAQRGFAKPADLATGIAVIDAFGTAQPMIDIAPDDAFVTMLDAQCQAIATKQFAAERTRICDRAALIEQVRELVFPSN